MSEHSAVADRRRFLTLCVGAVGMTIAARESGAADLPHLAPSDPTAAALGYVEDTNSVVAAKYPQHKPTQACATCQQFKPLEGSALGTCTIFSGKAVNSHGWCGAYVAKA